MVYHMSKFREEIYTAVPYYKYIYSLPTGIGLNGMQNILIASW